MGEAKQGRGSQEGREKRSALLFVFRMEGKSSAPEAAASLGWPSGGGLSTDSCNPAHPHLSRSAPPGITPLCRPVCRCPRPYSSTSGHTYSLARGPLPHNSVQWLHCLSFTSFPSIVQECGHSGTRNMNNRSLHRNSYNCCSSSYIC